MTKHPRAQTITVLLLVGLGLTACGDDPEPGDPSWANGSPTPATAEAAPAEAPQESPAGGRGARRPAESPSTPPFTMPKRDPAAPAARKVVDAFKAAGLTVTNVRDRSADCGPDGAGLGCAELLVTDAVRVYVFPDEANASNQSDVWGADAYREGAVVLSYAGTKTSGAERKRYNDVLAKLG
ncbi:hypothetical protein [Micromonospora sp. KC213]|uniref:hypothetical protein n=1 Tax=Micromonospora sp. KC213 TaxID=2530378 RepID=UPI00104AF354|nr:hypothetical protein [Micromonospora sp. KC213]TDC43271.1 hypothetical protein E1166_04580 [Micromonospora sp. KC213]